MERSQGKGVLRVFILEIFWIKLDSESEFEEN